MGFALCRGAVHVLEVNSLASSPSSALGTWIMRAP